MTLKLTSEFKLSEELLNSLDIVYLIIMEYTISQLAVVAHFAMHPGIEWVQ